MTNLMVFATTPSCHSDDVSSTAPKCRPVSMAPDTTEVITTSACAALLSAGLPSALAVARNSAVLPQYACPTRITPVQQSSEVWSSRACSR